MFRLYGKTIHEWVEQTENRHITKLVQIELEYVDHYDDGRMVKGSEDFSRDRLESETRWAYVYTWDGETYNKGNHRWFECRGLIRYRRKEVKAVKQWLMKKYNAKFVELR